MQTIREFINDCKQELIAAGFDKEYLRTAEHIMLAAEKLYFAGVPGSDAGRELATRFEKEKAR